MMRLCAAIVAFGISSVAFAGHHSMIFKGKGQWKNTAGESGTYELLMRKKMLDGNRLRITTTIEKTNGETHMHAIVVHHQEHQMLKITDLGGNDIGWGYYYAMEGSKVIHMEIKPKDGVTVEKTIHGGLDKFHSVGSMRDADGTTTWVDYGKRIFPAEDES